MGAAQRWPTRGTAKLSDQQHHAPRRRHSRPGGGAVASAAGSAGSANAGRCVLILYVTPPRRGDGMNSLHVLYQMVRADFLERVRRYSFLVTLAFAVYLGYLAYSGQMVMRLGDYRGVYNTAWLSALMTLVTTTFLSLVGFYVVRNSVDRDQQTRVGRILAAAPMTRFLYTAAKVVSNFAVLSAMVLVLMGAAIEIGRATRLNSS